ncbi:MAG: hypothetical protein JST75_16225 [Bacteroidetes bacterium]|nr:hypothetical protein [Bacteroidota bacterium]
MAYPDIQLIEALRNTAKKLSEGSYYAWGHHGACNCGSLLQVITSMTKEEILSYAHTGTGEWTEIAEDYCTVTGAPAYLMISKLEKLGLTITDIHHLEYLDDRKILEHLPGGFRWLKRNIREDVIIYFETFANILEGELLNNKLRKEQEKKDLQPEWFAEEAAAVFA